MKLINCIPLFILIMIFAGCKPERGENVVYVSMSIKISDLILTRESYDREGNMTGKHILLLVLAIISPWVIPSVVLGLGLLVSVVQALVFTLLTICYFAGAVEEAH